MKKLMVVLLTAVCILISVNVFAEKKDYVIAVQDLPEYLPESSFQNKEYTGFGRELLDMFAKSYGYSFTYSALSIKRGNADFLGGSVDLKYPDNEKWVADLKKGKNVKYSVPVVKYIDGVMVLPKNVGKGLSSLKNLGIPMGFTPFAYKAQIDAGTLKVSENPNMGALLKQVLAERVDGALANISVVSYYLSKSGKPGEKLDFDPSLPYTKSTRHLSTIKHPEVIDNFNKFMEKEKDKVQKLKDKYKIETLVNTVK